MGVDPQLLIDVWPAYAYLLGVYLGDGCISRHKRAFRLRITLDGVYPVIVAECKAAMEAVVPNRVLVQQTSSRAVEVSAYSRAWPQLLPQHGRGPKHERSIVLSPS